MSAPGPFGDTAPNFPVAPSAGGGMDFVGGFPQPMQQQQQQQGAVAPAAGGNPPAETCTELAKVCKNDEVSGFLQVVYRTPAAAAVLFVILG